MQKYRRKVRGSKYKEKTSNNSKKQAVYYAFSHCNFYSAFRELPSNSSATILVAARLIPEFANVIANVYIDMINSNIPRTFTTELVCNINTKKYIYRTHKKSRKC